MEIRTVEQCAVVVSLSPADCLLLADACRIAGHEQGIAKGHPFTLAAAHLEGLALIASAQAYVAENTRFLAEWTLPGVRRAWPHATAAAAEGGAPPE